MGRRLTALGASVSIALLTGGCVVGPKYHTPAVQVPPSYKEAVPPTPPPPAVPASSVAPSPSGTPGKASPSNGNAASPSGSAQPNGTAVQSSSSPQIAPPFLLAQPNDNALRGDWWEMFNDSELNALEAQVNVSNQNIARAMAAFYSSRALVREARSEYFPVLSTTPSISRGHTSSDTRANFFLPGDAAWVPDLWGRIRNTVASNTAAAQISAADLENTRLSMHADLAIDYFLLRGQDNLKELLDSTVTAYQQSLDLTNVLYQTGIDSDESVAQAETQLESAQAADTNVAILRSQYEHAIAVLVGQPPSTFSIPPVSKQPAPPQIPVAAPSNLLERRPDIAAAERAMAQANAQIGIATAAYYPSVSLTGTAGFQSTSIVDWFTWPSRVWSIGASLSQTLFDAGLRKATVQQFRGVFDEDVASYRETVLAAFQQVEDDLSVERILTEQIQQQDSAVQSAQRYLSLATERYRLGIDPYLNVITAETTLLTNQRTAVDLRTQQMTSAVDLIEALGGGWDKSQLPSSQAVAQVSTPAVPAQHAAASQPNP